MPVVESLVFSTQRPLSLGRLAAVLKDVPADLLSETLDSLRSDYQHWRRGIELVEVAGGYQFRTKSCYASWVGLMRSQRPFKLSRAALETLAIIAYKQPATRAEVEDPRAEVEDLRGVELSGLLHQLLERGLVKVAGKKAVPGRPFLYATTKTFLEVFGLKDLSSLPSLKDWEELKAPGAG
jgi:segregation and condensation protein B